jgi:hypothetical protein
MQEVLIFEAMLSKWVSDYLVDKGIAWFVAISGKQGRSPKGMRTNARTTRI